MPTIAMFYGILVRMYYAPKEHNPPHIHAFYQDQQVVVEITENKVIEGSFPLTQLRFLQSWVDIHKEELLANWNLCQNSEPLFKIDPLR
ncbi:MAG: DUF4160 domain-containing protein [Bacteroidales bacterium]